MDLSLILGLLQSGGSLIVFLCVCALPCPVQIVAGTDTARSTQHLPPCPAGVEHPCPSAGRRRPLACSDQTRPSSEQTP